VANFNAASELIGMSTSGQSEKHLFNQSITGRDPTAVIELTPDERGWPLLEDAFQALVQAAA